MSAENPLLSCPCKKIPLHIEHFVDYPALAFCLHPLIPLERLKTKNLLKSINKPDFYSRGGSNGVWHIS
jgi:hypothetical protein